MATQWTITGDATDPQTVAAFWCQALGYVAEPGYEDPDGASIVDPEGRAPAISWLRVLEGKTTKNRLHLDIRVTAQAGSDSAGRERLIRAKVHELVDLGAAVVREVLYQGRLGHVVMLDPEGNEFCVA